MSGWERLSAGGRPQGATGWGPGGALL